MRGITLFTLLGHGTKEKCLDKAKELLDILASGGNNIFGFDKVPVHLSDAKPENLNAVCEYIVENGKY